MRKKGTMRNKRSALVALHCLALPFFANCGLHSSGSIRGSLGHGLASCRHAARLQLFLRPPTGDIFGRSFPPAASRRGNHRSSLCAQSARGPAPHAGAAAVGMLVPRVGSPFASFSSSSSGAEGGSSVWMRAGKLSGHCGSARRTSTSMSAGDSPAGGGRRGDGEDGIETIVDVVGKSIKEGSFVKASLGGNTAKDSELKTVFFRPVKLKRGIFVQALYRYKTNDQVKNHPLPEAGDVVRGLLAGEEFQQASVFTTEGDYNLSVKKGKHVVAKAPGPPQFDEVVIEGNDRKKNVPVEAASDFLQELGVSNKDGKPRPGMQDKLRQIQKFVSIVDGLVDSAGLKEGGSNREEGRPLKVVDMGCGKGYLTFATHSHLSKSRGVSLRTEGIELRRDLVEKTNAIARKVKMGPEGDGDRSGLVFREGYISEHSDRFKEEGLDVLIALHACDTATDDAIMCGVEAGANVIVVAPCCHKQVRRQIEANKGGQKGGVLQDMFRHGILREREAESVTDTARALLLEMAGYTSSVFEFIGGEHTAKNTMITAVKRDKEVKNVQHLESRLADFLQFYGVKEQHLATLLKVDLPGGGGDAAAGGRGGEKGTGARAKARNTGKSIDIV